MSIVTPSDKRGSKRLQGRKIGHLRGWAGSIGPARRRDSMRHTWIGVAMTVALSVARPTQAATAAGSWTNGGMIGSDTGAFYGTAGFPGLNIGYLRGMGDTLD